MKNKVFILRRTLARQKKNDLQFIISICQKKEKKQIHFKILLFVSLSLSLLIFNSCILI